MELGDDVRCCACAGLIVVIRALLAGSSILCDSHSPMGQPDRERRIARPDVRRDNGDVPWRNEDVAEPLASAPGGAELNARRYTTMSNSSVSRDRRHTEDVGEASAE